MHICMGNLGFPRVCLYWTLKHKIPLIAKTMPVNRFFKLQHALSSNNIDEADPDNPDKLFLIRPLIDAFQKTCRDIAEE